MAIALLTELEKQNEVSFEIDFGFSVVEFLSSYRKRFHNNKYTSFKVSYFYTAEEAQLFETFFIETLNYGLINFTTDLNVGFGNKEYIITEKPVFSQIEADLYKIELSLLQIAITEEIICLNLKSCLKALITNLEGSSTLVSSNVSASEMKKQLTLCIINLKNMINSTDINAYVELKVLTEQEVQ